MNLLLVDDEYDVLHGILNGVDFPAIGVDHVYTAQSAGDAKELLEKREIDVMVTDIEMPGESGLDLMRWVRDRELFPVMLFCTVYADFNYAQKAVELHSFDYFLKPIFYPALQERISAAVEEAKRLRRERNYQESGRHLEESRSELARNYWWDALCGPASDPAQLLRRGEREPLSYGEASRFTLCLLTLWEEKLPSWKKYAFQNMAEEIFGGTESFSAETLFSESETGWCLVLLDQGPGETEKFRELCGAAANLLERHLELKISCYYAAGLPLEVLRDAHGALLEICNDDVSARFPLVKLGEHRETEVSSAPLLLPLEEWELLLESGREEELLEEFSATLDRLAGRDQVNRRVLNALGLDITQMVHTVLKAHHINAGDLFSNEEHDRLRERSAASLAGMRLYLQYLVHTAREAVLLSARTQTVAEQMKAYVKEHYTEEITCASMSKVFFLNADYLARLFKRETGQPLNDYLHDCRVFEAKKLLAQTDLPIHAVAQRVGYDSFSYFSFVFRKKEKVSPNEYRKGLKG